MSGELERSKERSTFRIYSDSGADSFFITETKAIADRPENCCWSTSKSQSLLSSNTEYSFDDTIRWWNFESSDGVAWTSNGSVDDEINNLEQFLLIKQNQKLVNEQASSNCQNNSELIKSLLDQIEHLRRENSAKSNLILNLLNNNKVLFNNQEKLSNIDKSNFENPKRAAKSKIVAEDKTESI